eukprot:GHVS01097471.1.p1 GENE.GHVS01097471.1~~GHVS01097471.1.p1  ORF type:complete len:664 (-),score=78.05 GHVS01097471.1:202-2193(-)
MSQFRDTFTKEEKKEPLLDYDDSAFLFFAGTILLVVLIPWTYSLFSRLLLGPSHNSVYPTKDTKTSSTIRYCQCDQCVTKITKKKKEMEGWGVRLSWSAVGELCGIAVLWVLFAWLCRSLKDMKAIQTFDPFAILDLTSSASTKEIKKAYRVMSLKYHPDKNTHDTTAAAKFMLITKAYQALTDEVAKANFEKYGNPDGPGIMKVGIGLPRFLVEEEFQLLILSVFFVILLVVIPMCFLCYYRKQKKFAPNGVQVETLHFLSYYMNESTRIKNCPEYLAASAESRELAIRPTDDSDMRALIDEAVEPKKRAFQVPIVVRNYMLILGHMQRLHGLLTPWLFEDLNQILRCSMLITQSMLEIATLRDWVLTAQSMLEFRRCLLQSLDIRGSSLMQVPHFDGEVLRHCHKGKNAVKELSDFMHQSTEERKGLTRMNQQQLADVQAFCSHVSDMKIKAYVEVDDEKEISVGDVATCNIQLTRQNLQEGEAVGPIHAPFFPEVKHEEWWILLVDKSDGRVLAFCCSKSCERVVVERVQFAVQRPGKHNLVVQAMCDSYAGIDVQLNVEYKALAESEVHREVFVHPEDEALDNEPTLFQQMLGQLEDDNSSEDEEDEDCEETAATGNKDDSSSGSSGGVGNTKQQENKVQQDENRLQQEKDKTLSEEEQ